MALSSTESEYIGTCDDMKEGLWLRGLLKEIDFIDEIFRIYT